MGLLDDYDMTPEEFLRAHDLVPRYDGQGKLVVGGRREGYADEIGYEDVDESTQSRTVFVQDVSEWTLDDELKEAFSKGNYGALTPTTQERVMHGSSSTHLARLSQPPLPWMGP